MQIVRDLPEHYIIDGVAPDRYIHSDSKLLERPNNDFIVSRDALGNEVSRYGDGVWDFKAYATGSVDNFNFKKSFSLNQIEDAKWLFFVMDRVVHAKGSRNGNTYSVSTLMTIFKLFKTFCNFADKHKMGAIDLLKNEKLMALLVQENLTNTSFVNHMRATMNKLIEVGYELLGFVPILNEISLQRLRKAGSYIEQKKEQTPVIPPRLYSQYVTSLWDIISEYEAVEKPILLALKLFVEIRGLTKDTRFTEAAKQTIELVKEERLKSFADKYNLLAYKKNSRTGVINFKGFSSKRLSKYINQLMLVCKQLIHVYTGMRDTEVLNLPHHCFHEDNDKKRKKARLLGYTFKYTGNKTHGEWVTTVELERVVGILQRLNEVKFNNIKSILPNVTLNQKPKSNEVPCSLFSSVRYFFNDEKVMEKCSIVLAQLSNSVRIESGVFCFEKFKVTEQDMCFLERLEPERNWRKSEYAVGTTWPFRTHQFRRSLAVYSRQSGLVDIGALQTQLHHLWVETSYYYSNNAENCTFDTSDQDHMAKLFTKEQPIADFAAFIQSFLWSDEPLHGAQGRTHEKTIRQVDDKEQWIFDNRKDMTAKFKRGEIAFKETPLGACNSTKPCDKALTKNFIGCIACEGASIKASKVERTVQRQSQFVATLDIKSPEYRAEQAELDELTKLKELVV